MRVWAEEQEVWNSFLLSRTGVVLLMFASPTRLPIVFPIIAAATQVQRKIGHSNVYE
jgi:hypothetical protein